MSVENLDVFIDDFQHVLDYNIYFSCILEHFALCE